jgi:hypothetical protein
MINPIIFNHIFFDYLKVFKVISKRPKLLIDTNMAQYITDSDNKSIALRNKYNNNINKYILTNFWERDELKNKTIFQKCVIFFGISGILGCLFFVKNINENYK